MHVMDLGDFNATPLPPKPSVVEKSAEQQTESNRRLPSVERTGAQTATPYILRVERNIEQLPVTDSDRQHFISCPLSDCNRCYFTMYKLPWQGKLPVDAGRPEHGTWLRSEVVNGVWALHCCPCRAAGATALLVSQTGTCCV